MVLIDIDKEMRRRKKEQREIDKTIWNETEKQMKDIWANDDANDRTARALRRLEYAREQRKYALSKNTLNKKLTIPLVAEPKLENIIISQHQNVIIG